MSNESDMMQMVESVPAPVKVRASFAVSIPMNAFSVCLGAEGLERALDAADEASKAGREGMVISQIAWGIDAEGHRTENLMIRGAFLPQEKARQFEQLSKDLATNDHSTLYTALRNLVKMYERVAQEFFDVEDDSLDELKEAYAALAAVDGGEVAT